MFRTCFRGAVLAVLALAVSAAAHAATTPAKPRARTWADPAKLPPGGASFTLLTGASTPVQDFRRVAGSGALAAISGNYRMTRAIELSADLGVARSDGSTSGETVTTSQGTLTTQENWTTSWYGGHASYHLMTIGFPYVRLGTGVYRIKYRLDALKPTPTSLIGGDVTGTRPGLNAGIGGSFQMAPATRLGLEVVYHRILLGNVRPALITTAATMTFGGVK